MYNISPNASAIIECTCATRSLLYRGMEPQKRLHGMAHVFYAKRNKRQTPVTNLLQINKKIYCMMIYFALLHIAMCYRT